MNLPSLVKYQSRILPGGLALLNSSLIDAKEANRSDIELLPIPFNDIAIEIGNPRLANMVALGAFVAKTKVVQISSLFGSLEKVIDGRYHSLIPPILRPLKKEPILFKTFISPLKKIGRNPVFSLGQGQRWKNGRQEGNKRDPVGEKIKALRNRRGSL